MTTLDEANKKAVYGIGAAIIIGAIATGIAYFATETQNYVAKVDGTRITTEEYDKEFARVKGSPMGQMQPEEMLKHGVVGQLIDRQLLMAEAAKRHVTPTAEQENAKYEEIRKPYVDPQNPTSDEKFNKVLEANHMTSAELKARIHESAVVEAFGKDLTKGTTITENEVHQYFDKNPQFFKNEEEVRASHILVKDEAKAKELLAKIKAGGDFAALAKANSLDGSKEQGGDLGFFKRGAMVPEFENAAFSLKPGEVSNVVKSQFGYHIIKVTDKHPAVTKTFDQVKDDAKERLTKERTSDALQKWITDARKNAKVEYKEGFAPAPTPGPSSSPAASAAPAASGAAPAATGAAPAATPIPTQKPGETPANSTKGHAPTAAPSK